MSILNTASLTRGLMTALVVLCLGISLSACGKKSALSPPEDSQYPKQYPRR